LKDVERSGRGLFSAVHLTVVAGIMLHMADIIIFATDLKGN
jgi:hypothetical protein